MFRIRMAGVLVAALSLLAAACGEDAAEVETTPLTTAPAVEPDDSPETDGTEASEPDAITDGGESDAGSDEPGEASAADDGDPAAPVDAEALLASATTVLDGRSVRGEATIEFTPVVEMSTSFEFDAEGDLAAKVELPPGFDSEFPADADAEMRYVGGVVYVRQPVPAENLAELGVDEAWYVAEPAATDDAMAQAMGSPGVMCIFPQVIAEPIADCDPVGETGALLEAATGAEIVSRQDVRGVETTRVRFLVSLLDLVGETLGIEPEDGETGEGEGGAFDDTASDPFAEGVEQIFGFLDAEFEIDVWIDDENLIRRLSFDLASLFAGIAGPEAAADMPSSQLTLEFYDFDADISVDAPPPELLVDPSLIKDYGGGAGGEYEPEQAEDYYEPDEPGS